VTFTATVSLAASSQATPTGTVTFYDDGTELGTTDLVTSGGATTATLSSSNLPVGRHLITATYSGDDQCKTSTSSAITETVAKAGTSTTLVASATQSIFGDEVEFTATVRAATGDPGIATGTVVFKEGSKTLYTSELALVDGLPTATFTTDTLKVGRRRITAAYSGDANLKNSTSTAITETVAKAGTTTTVDVSADDPVYGQPVTITVTITSASASATPPTGKVTFKDGTRTLGNVNVTTVDGVTTAVLTTTRLSVGPHTITAGYAGSGNFSASSGNQVQLTVEKAHTTTTLTSSVNPSSPNQKVTFTATVSISAPGAGRLTGVVTFYDGGTKLGTGRLRTAGGVTTATFTTKLVAQGNHTITASYAGDKNFDASDSEALTQIVQSATAGTSGANDAALLALMAQWRLQPLQPGLAPVEVMGPGTVLGADPLAGDPFEDHRVA
jgi:hypothetical protein